MKERDKKVQWPGWETVRLIGRGSFGAVYEIERDVFGHKEKAALKVITIPQSESDIDDLMSDGYDEESITTRFEGYLHDIVREYSLMADMKGCANIVYCDDVKYIQHDNGIGWDIFIKMELLTSLTKALGKTVSDEQAIKIGTDICSALAFCEKRNLLHRDIKPQNIFVAPDGTYKLGDFGIAKTAERTTSGTKTGTYKYMAPEVYNNQPYGGKADIYSLGLVLYWLLNERRTPFLPLPPTMPTSSEEDKARTRRFSGEPIPAPAHGSEELQRIVLKACAYDPNDRYQSAEEMLRELKAVGDKNVVPAVIAPEVDKEKEAEDEKTVSALAVDRDVADKADSNTERATHEETVTVSAFDRRQTEEKPEEPERPDQPVKKKSHWGVIAGIAAILAVTVGLAFFFWPQYGEWSEWSIEEPAQISGRRIEEGLEYRFRDYGTLETTDEDTVNGRIVNERSEYSDWSEWSDWIEKNSDQYILKTNQTENADNAVSASGTINDLEETKVLEESDTVRIEEEQLYRSRTISYVTAYSDWGDWSGWSSTAVSASDNQEVQTKTVYYYPATGYACKSCGRVFPEFKVNCVGHVYREHNSEVDDLYNALKERGDEADRDAIVASYFYSISTTLVSESPDAYPDGRSPEGYLVGSPTAGILYNVRTRSLEEQVQYSKWSEWSKDKITASNNLEVEAKTMWHYSTRRMETIYTYEDWSDWSDWSFDAVSETSDREVETRTVYRYQDRQ